MEQRPVLLLSDGHKTRVTVPVVRILLQHNIRLFLSPPQCTTLYQALDKMFQFFHPAYAKKLASLVESLKQRKLNSAVTRAVAVKAKLLVIRDRWATQKVILGAWKRVGITPAGLNSHDVSEKKLLPATAPVQHDPRMSEDTRALEREKDRFMMPSFPESPERRRDEKKIDYVARDKDFWKSVAMRAIVTPSSAREAGLLPHRKETGLPGEEFGLVSDTIRRKRRKHSSHVGSIDLEGLASKYEAEEQERRKEAEAKQKIRDEEAPIRKVLQARGDLKDPEEAPTVSAMKQLCRQRGLSATGKRGDLVQRLLEHLRIPPVSPTSSET